ncbi:MAG: Rdx family protein [Chloroflexota bacterium]|nr:Rdx family protein [Chloroflexota bacterium]MDQ5867207.1 Rdx family protein [Chloroflexota bacterium]
MAEELIEAYGDDLETITLVRGGKGRFEVTADGQEVYSKSRTKRHAEPGEVVENLGNLLQGKTRNGLTPDIPLSTGL